MTIPIRFLTLSLLCIAMVAVSVAQSVPQLVNYQGRLANPDGSPFPTADYELSIRIYDAITNGMLVWGPQFFDGKVGAGHGVMVPIVQGYFNLVLGPVDTSTNSLANAFASEYRYVEVTVSNRLAIHPRQQILSTPYAIQSGNGSPPGTISAFGGETIPAGWMLCDGRLKSISDYPLLFLAIGSRWGTNSSTHFRLPDLRGMFLRGVNGNRSDEYADPADGRRGLFGSGASQGPGSYQFDQFTSHSHTFRRAIPGIFPGTSLGIFADDNNNYLDSDYTVGINSRGGTETRPKNAYVHYIIKY